MAADTNVLIVLEDNTITGFYRIHIIQRTHQTLFALLSSCNVEGLHYHK